MDVAVYAGPCLGLSPAEDLGTTPWWRRWAHSPPPSLGHLLIVSKSPTLFNTETPSSPQWGCTRLQTPYEETQNRTQSEKGIQFCPDKSKFWFNIPHSSHSWTRLFFTTWWLSHGIFCNLLQEYHPQLQRLEAKNYISQTPLQLGFWMQIWFYQWDTLTQQGEAQAVSYFLGWCTGGDFWVSLQQNSSLGWQLHEERDAATETSQTHCSQV